MADSDDEYDRKRRDKFRGERTESYSREGRRDDRRRDDWVERYNLFQIMYIVLYVISEILALLMMIYDLFEKIVVNLK